MTRRRGPAVASGLAALITLLAVVAGLPVLLYKLGGSPLPGHLPGLTQIGRDLLHRDSASVVLDAVRDVSWIAWAAFSLAVLAEVQAVLRRRTPPRLRLGGMQHAAGRLVALAALTFTSAPVGTLLAMPQPATAAFVTSAPRPDPAALQAQTMAEVTPAAPHADLAGGAQEDAIAARPGAQGMSMGFFQLVTVKPGDCLWTIAQHYLGNGDRYQEIVALNLGHDMGRGHTFSDPSVVWPGWVLHLPARGDGHVPGPAQPHAGSAHPGHPTSHPRYRHPHPAASSAASSAAAPAASASSPAITAPSPPVAAGPGTAAPAAPAGSAQQASSDATTMAPVPGSQLTLLEAFGTGVLAGGAAVGLALLRHRQRQTRRRGRRIPLPASAPVAEAEQRLHLAATQQPVTGLRGVLHYLGAGLLATGKQIPDISALWLRADFLEVLVASPAAEPPPDPFTVPGGRQGMAWRLQLTEELDEPAVEVGDLLPGLLTIGTSDGGYLLADLEHLQVTTVNGPPAMSAAVLRSAAAELATGQLAGWFDLILVGFPELAVLGGRGTCCDSLDAGLDLLAAKAVALRRRLGNAPLAEVRYHRLADPADEDWALTLLVSSVPPTSGQLALLTDLASDPGGIAALVPGGAEPLDGHRAPATIDLAAGPVASGAIVARISPLQLEAQAAALDDADYEALTSLFAMALEGSDVGPADPPYDSWTWPPDVVSGDDELTGGLGPAGELDDLDRADPVPGSAPAEGTLRDDIGLADDAGLADAGLADDGALTDGALTAETDWAGEPLQADPAHWAAPPVWAAEPDQAAAPAWTSPDDAAGPAWTADPDRAASPAWGAEPAQAASPAWPAEPHQSADVAWAANADQAGDLAWAAELDQAASPAWAAEPDQTANPVPAADQAAWPAGPGWPGEPAGTGPAGWAENGDDPAATGLPGQPAAWLHEPASAPPPDSPLPDSPLPAGADSPALPAEPARVQPADPAGTDQQNLRIGVLGTFTINGQPGALLPAQSQLVLALALHGSSGLSNQQLCYLLGADPDRPKPSDSLRQLIVRTRRQLGRAPDGREWIQHLGGGQYALNPAARFDWHEFDALATEGMRSRDAELLRRALGLLRGRPFTGCYYWWLDLAMTETVRAQIVDAADVLAALELAAGDPAAAARAARIGLAGDAGAEQLWRALMRAEHAAGNLTGVREAWNRCLDAISEIAPDGEPHPGTAALYRHLLGDASARPAWAGG
ncbi:MAG TPA: LysM peptidoglycan-binding domain-containing protein [Streptosporangiaceae bacterium]